MIFESIVDKYIVLLPTIAISIIGIGVWSKSRKSVMTFCGIVAIYYANSNIDEPSGKWDARNSAPLRTAEFINGIASFSMKLSEFTFPVNVTFTVVARPS